MLQSELSSFQIAAIRLRVQGNAMRRPDQRVPNPVKNPGPPDCKAHAKLGARIKEWAEQNEAGIGWWAGRSGPAKRHEGGGYHKPGSMQR